MTKDLFLGLGRIADPQFRHKQLMPSSTIYSSQRKQRSDYKRNLEGVTNELHVSRLNPVTRYSLAADHLIVQD